MNDIFKLFKKRVKAGKGTNITDVIKDLNESEQNEIMISTSSRFDRANKSYLSISKSGRLKSKKSQNNSRIVNEDMFNPANNNIYNENSFVNKEIVTDNRKNNEYLKKNKSSTISLDDSPQQQPINIQPNNNNNYLFNNNNYNFNNDVFLKNSLLQKNF